MSGPLADRLARLDAALESIARAHPGAALANSLSAEDMLLTDAIARGGLPLAVFVLDTGRLHGDTLDLVGAIRARYPIELEVWRPDPGALEAFAARHGADAFYGSPALRARCCELRKVEPLSRALAGRPAWISGQRREHSPTRAALAEREIDLRHRIPKYNPLAAWTEAELWQALGAREVPVNRLYRQGYRSIGCAPCTRPVLPGEDARAGRWWWEAPEKRECGLHRKVA